MTSRAILYPVFAMVLLTVVVAVVMYRQRVAEMRARRIHPQAVASASQMMSCLERTGAADNFRNLFETPVLFYVAALSIHATQLASPAYVVMAWLYVALRVVHSAIHCSYNNVIHRLLVFMGGFAVLVAIWVLLAADIAAGSGT